MTVTEFCSALDALCPASLSAAWDHDGVACMPNGARQVRRVLVTLDVTAAAVARAVGGGFDVILSHHPLLFHPVGALVETEPVPRRLLSLAAAGIAAVSLHTRLDAAEGGVNDVLAALLGVKNAVPFGPAGEVPCGRIGEISPQTVAEFAAFVKEKLHAPAVRYAGEGLVRRVAVLGGEGGDYVEAARAAGADAFLAGRIGYHRMLEAAEAGLAGIEAGHYDTEAPVLARLVQLVKEIDATVETELFDSAIIRAI